MPAAVDIAGPIAGGYYGDGMPVQITELAAPFRVVVLAGRDRPEQPVGVGSEQRAVTTHYPGSRVASVQVLGTREDPIELRGWFQDPLSFLDGGPAARIALLRGLMQGQSRCSLQWGTAIMRWGRIERARFEFHTATRIRYELTFAVDQPNEAVALTPLPVGVGAASQLADLAVQARAALGLAIEAADTVLTLGAVVT